MNVLEKFYVVKKFFKNPKVFWLGAIFLFVLALGFYFAMQNDSKSSLAGEQIQQMVNQVRSFYKNKPDAWGLNTYSAIKNNIVAPDMLDGRQIKNALGKDVLLGSDVLGNTVMPGSRTFAIIYKNLDYDECLALASFPFPRKVMLSLDSINIVNDKTYIFSWGQNLALPISEKEAQISCKKSNDVLWNFYL